MSSRKRVRFNDFQMPMQVVSEFNNLKLSEKCLKFITFSRNTSHHGLLHHFILSICNRKKPNTTLGDPCLSRLRSTRPQPLIQGTLLRRGLINMSKSSRQHCSANPMRRTVTMKRMMRTTYNHKDQITTWTICSEMKKRMSLFFMKRDTVVADHLKAMTAKNSMTTLTRSLSLTVQRTKRHLRT